MGIRRGAPKPIEEMFGIVNKDSRDLQNCLLTREQIIDRVDELIRQNMRILEDNRKCIESDEDQQVFDLLAERLTGANEALLEIRRLL